MSDLRWCAIALAVAPIYGMIILGTALHCEPRPAARWRPVVEWGSTAPVFVYARCLSNPSRHQSEDGIWELLGDRRMSLSQCWEDS